MLTNEQFIQLADKHLDMVYRIAYNAVKHPSDADDVTQNVMLRLCRAAPDFASEEHAKRWLIRVALNESKRLVTSAWRQKTVPLEEQTVAPIPFDTQEESALFAEVMKLPPKYRVPLYLYYYEGYAVAEIAELLSAKESTIQTRLARARAKLKLTLTEEWNHA